MKKTIEKLSKTIGERHLGSKGEREAQGFIEKELRDRGYDVVMEKFSSPGWRYGEFGLTLEDGSKLDVFPCFFSPGGEVCGRLKTFSSQVALEDMKGTVAFAGNYDFVQVGDTNALAKQLEEAGALAFIINSPYNDTWSTKIVRSPDLKRMPVFTLSQRTAMRLAREEGKEVKLRLDAECFEHESYNVVGRYCPLEGSARGKLVIGAHYDTAPGIPGAVDNASGVAMLLEVAKGLRDQWGDWDVDLVAFGGEEYGGPGYGIGGYHYFNLHVGEAIRVMVCLDGLGSYLTQPLACVGKSSRMRALIRQTAVRSGIRVLPFRRGSDQGIFDKHGIPTVWFKDEGNPSGVQHFPLHSPQDDVELLDYQKLECLALDIQDFLREVVIAGIDEPAAPECCRSDQNDLESIVSIVRDVWTMGSDYGREKMYGRQMGGKPWQDWIEASVRTYISQQETAVFTIKQDGIIAGFISCRINPANGLGEIGYNAVSPAFLGRGYGKFLLDAALRHLREAGVREVEVVTGEDAGHAPARAVYESAGFQPFQRSIRYTLQLDGSKEKSTNP